MAALGLAQQEDGLVVVVDVVDVDIGVVAVGDVVDDGTEDVDIVVVACAR